MNVGIYGGRRRKVAALVVSLGLFLFFLYTTFLGEVQLTGLAIFERGSSGGFDIPGNGFPFAIPFFDGGQPPGEPGSPGDFVLNRSFDNESSSVSNGSGVVRRRGGGGSGGSQSSLPAIGPPLWRPHYGKFVGGRNPVWERFSDPSRICGGQAILQVPGVGMIKWNGCVNARFANFDRDVAIRGNLISVDSLRLHASFNSSAEITMENLSFGYRPAIYRDEVLCREPQCRVVSYENGNLVFTVSSFSSYTAGSNAGLDIWDESDLGKPYAGNVLYPNQGALFFANYTNLTSDQPITTASCVINFTDSSASMTYNATKGLYEHNKTFTVAGFYEFNVTCSASGFAELNTTDYSNVQTPASDLTNAGPSGAEVDVVGSSRAGATAPGSLLAISGNVTLATIGGQSITQSWQGYFGNVSGAVRLANGDGDVLYNWSSASPSGEVYASRSSTINFANISCASSLEILSEESHLSQEASDVDSIRNTFNQLLHPELFVGSTQITANSCNSTNIFDSSGAQNTSFFELLLSDNSGILVYTSILEQSLTGFDSRLHDFEMIVGEDGHGGDTAVTNYFFYVELN